jgi:hypothetical protein
MSFPPSIHLVYSSGCCLISWAIGISNRASQSSHRPDHLLWATRACGLSHKYICLVYLQHHTLLIIEWCFTIAYFFIDRIPTCIIYFHTPSPLECLLGETQDYTPSGFFFACVGHISCSYDNHKLDFWSNPCIFQGYIPLHKEYKFLHIYSH